MLTTTFKELKEANACKNSYRHLRRAFRCYKMDTPITIKQINDELNIYDMVWTIVCVCKRLDVIDDFFVYFRSLYSCGSHNHQRFINLHHDFNHSKTESYKYIVVRDAVTLTFSIPNENYVLLTEQNVKRKITELCYRKN